jgi:hypothetical protein
MKATQTKASHNHNQHDRSIRILGLSITKTLGLTEHLINLIHWSNDNNDNIKQTNKHNTATTATTTITTTTTTTTNKQTSTAKFLPALPS